MTTQASILQSALTRLSDIQPDLSKNGLDDALSTVSKVRDDLGKLAFNTLPLHPQLERVVESRRIDAVSVLDAMRSKLFNTDELANISDEDMRWLSMAAESFVLRCQDYLGSKCTLETVWGG